VLSDTFSEGKLKDLRGPFPSDQPTELDNHGFLDDNDLENVDDSADLTVGTPQPTAKTTEITPVKPGVPSKNTIYGIELTPAFSPGFGFWFENVGAVPPNRPTQPVDSGTHLGKGKVVVLRDVSFVT